MAIVDVIDHGQPAEFDWVAVRAAWTREKAFDAIRDVVMKDVIAIKPHIHDVIAFIPHAPESFAVTRDEEHSGAFGSARAASGSSDGPKRSSGGSA